MCCLFGFVDYGHSLSQRQKNHLIKHLSIACEARGTDATGIAYNSENRLHIYKKAVPARRLKPHIPHDANVVMGHTRMTTQGSEKRNQNNHPFRGHLEGQTFALAHNGVLYNDDHLRFQQNLPKTKIETDSYVAVQLIEKEKALNLASLCNMAEQVEGSFVFTVLDEADNLYFVKGENPLCIYHYPKLGLYIYASTEAILQSGLSKWRCSTGAPDRLTPACGEILRIDTAGCITTHTFDDTHIFRSRYSGSLWGGTYHWPSIPKAVDNDYVSELKSVATAFGYSPEDVDALIADGVSPEEIEDYFYCYCEV